MRVGPWGDPYMGISFDVERDRCLDLPWQRVDFWGGRWRSRLPAHACSLINLMGLRYGRAA